MNITLAEQEGIRLAIEGCGHGTLHAIYASVEEACKRKGWPSVDLLIIGGDFQSVRNAYDLNCVSMPSKFRAMHDFHEYYSGQRRAPCLTIFVGGNHEASNYLFELYYGGWVAPNIYYMGAANVLQLGPLRIAGMSGIWRGINYRKPHHERLPYNESDLKSIFDTREMDVRKLLQVRTQVDIGISHDWPKGVVWKGNWKQLFQFKKFLEDDARSGRLGNAAAQQALDHLRPGHWFSAHLHCKYVATIEHDQTVEPQMSLPATDGGIANSRSENEIDLDNDVDQAAEQPVANANADEIDLELDEDVDGVAPVASGQGMDGVQVPLQPDVTVDGPAMFGEDVRAALPEAFRRQPSPKLASTQKVLEKPADIKNHITRFLALDKCGPKRHFLQLMSIPAEGGLNAVRPLKLAYDREWLAITRAFALSEPPTLGDPAARVPQAKTQAAYKTLIDEQQKWLKSNLQDGDLTIPEDFEVTAPVYDGGNFDLPQYNTVDEYPNPQTARFCGMLQIPNAFEISAEKRAARMAAGPPPEPNPEDYNSGDRGRGRGRGRGGFGRGRGRGGHGGRGRGRGGGRARGR